MLTSYLPFLKASFMNLRAASRFSVTTPVSR
jgi:hypothetical protein